MSVSSGVSYTVGTFSWKTKQERRATHCSTVRSLNAPLNMSSVSSNSSPLIEIERERERERERGGGGGGGYMN